MKRIYHAFGDSFPREDNNKNRPNPLYGTVSGPNGVPLPDNWKEIADYNKANYDRIYKEKLENAWKNPQWSNKLNYGVPKYKEENQNPGGE